MTASAPVRRLSFTDKMLYGFGSIAFGAKLQVMGLLLFYYNQVVGLPGGWVSLALGVSLLIDAVWEPAVGQFSDTLRTPWGRRHPLMYASAVPVAICFVLMWRPPPGLSHAQTFAWLLTFVILTRLFASLYEVPSSALAPELAPDYDDRTTTLSYRFIWGVIGGAGVSSLGFFWFFRPTPAYPSGQLNPAAWGPLTLVVAAVIIVSILISTAGTHHRIPSLHKPPARKVDFGNLVGEMATTLRNRNFIVAIAAALIAGFGTALYSGLAIYLDTFFWRLPAQAIGFLTLSGLVASFPAAFVATTYSRRVGKKQACINLFFLSVLLNQSPILLRLLGAFPGPGDPALMPILLVQRLLFGVAAVGGFICVTSMIADITEDAQRQTGRRSEGLLMSADAFVTKAVSSLSALLPGLLLAFVHFPVKAQPATIDPAIVRHMAWIYLPVTTTISLLSIATWYLYRIDKQTHEHNLATVGEGQALAEASLDTGAPAAPLAPHLAG